MNYPKTNLVVKLQDAIAAGYHHNFTMVDGTLYSPFIAETYHISLVEKTVFVCELVKANLYQIITPTGQMGTLILSWADIATEEF